MWEDLWLVGSSKEKQIQIFYPRLDKVGRKSASAPNSKLFEALDTGLPGIFIFHRHNINVGWGKNPGKID